MAAGFCVRLYKIVEKIYTKVKNWLKDAGCDLYMIPGYWIVTTHRADRIAGVAICIKDNIDFIERNDLAIFNDVF